MILDKFRLDGKNAIITGGNSGIGRSIAIALAEAGANVVIAARNEAKTMAVVKEIESLGREALGIKTDISLEGDVKNMIEVSIKNFDRIHIIVNSSGVFTTLPASEMTAGEWDRVMGVNLKGLFFCCRDIGKHMIACGGGKIINISSVLGFIGTSFVLPYSASKGGIVQMTKCLAIEWARFNVYVNAIAPGWVETEMSEVAKSNESFFNKTIRAIPLRRWGQPDEMAGMAIYLASDASSYVTGQTFLVDGGITIL
ncbi:MAG TPA: glucose 1-dehydrogenase [bacterium]